MRKLLALQEIDTQIHELMEAAKAYPERLAEIDTELAADRAESDAKQTELDALEVERKNIEAQIQMQKDQIKKWEARLTDIKTPREYAALSREIDIGKKGIRNQEEEVLNLLEQGEALKNEIERIERTILDKENGYAGERKELEGKIAGIEGDKAVLSERRKAATEAVEKRVLSQYDRIRTRRGGQAMAAALEGGSCGACRMRLRPQLYQELVSGRGGISQCPSCMRILYVAPEEEAAGLGDEAQT
ncbi:MAG: C4-type zinc ribbon domain-containing protein [Deltaproteobacteria bacterium]|nr:C4-type zinc ribbon domain-containing protein [Deltaproteobacteria bacterium]